MAHARNCFRDSFLKIIGIGPVLLEMVKSNALDWKLADSALFAGWAGVQIFWLIGCRPGNGGVTGSSDLLLLLLVSKSQAASPGEPVPVCEVLWMKGICKPW